MNYQKRHLEGHNAKRFTKISSLLKEFRRGYGYTREDIQREYGIPVSVIQRVESSKPENITLKTLLELSDIYMLSPSDLFEGIE